MEREELEKTYKDVYNTTELTKEFTVRGFHAPFVDVIRKADDARGTLTFQHRPRYYFNFKPE